MHIMVIDDEKILSKHLKTKLERNGYEVTLVESYAHFRAQKKLEDVDLFLVDMSLGDGNGIDIVKSLKQSEVTKNIPAIFISGHTEVTLKIKGLDAGANDYMVKPFEFNELLARIRSNMRISKPEVNSAKITFDEITFDTAKRKIYISGVEISLSKKEKQILEYFMLHPNICISKDKLQKMFWKNFPEFSVPENTINATICHMRKKLGKNFKLKTIVGEGYTLSR